MPGLSPEAIRKAKEIAADAPPLTPELRERLRAIIWGSPAPASTPATEPAANPAA